MLRLAIVIRLIQTIWFLFVVATYGEGCAVAVEKSSAPSTRNFSLLSRSSPSVASHLAVAARAAGTLINALNNACRRQARRRPKLCKGCRAQCEARHWFYLETVPAPYLSFPIVCHALGIPPHTIHSALPSAKVKKARCHQVFA